MFKKHHVPETGHETDPTSTRRDTKWIPSVAPLYSRMNRTYGVTLTWRNKGPEYLSVVESPTVMRILVVEDEPRIASFVAKGLREQAYAVDVCVDGDDALYKASINDYDAIILDVMIPGKDGFQVCSELRANGSTVPIIMLTARDHLQDRIEGLDSGADDYLTKPFAVAELLARLRALLRRGHVVRPEMIDVDDLSIDTRARRATRGGKSLPLTTKEYALLEYLAREQGRVVDRAELAEHVWDEHFDPFSNLIDVHINRLRNKVDKGFSPLIHTQRGVGYMLASLESAAENDV
jgi:DNA-binding response OmpR family regulator